MAAAGTALSVGIELVVGSAFRGTPSADVLVVVGEVSVVLPDGDLPRPKMPPNIERRLDLLRLMSPPSVEETGEVVVFLSAVVGSSSLWWWDATAAPVPATAAAPTPPAASSAFRLSASASSDLF